MSDGSEREVIHRRLAIADARIRALEAEVARLDGLATHHGQARAKAEADLAAARKHHEFCLLHPPGGRDSGEKLKGDRDASAKLPRAEAAANPPGLRQRERAEKAEADLADMKAEAGWWTDKLKQAVAGKAAWEVTANGYKADLAAAREELARYHAMTVGTNPRFDFTPPGGRESGDKSPDEGMRMDERLPPGKPDTKEGKRGPTVASAANPPGPLRIVDPFANPPGLDTGDSPAMRRAAERMNRRSAETKESDP